MLIPRSLKPEVLAGSRCPCLARMTESAPFWLGPGPGLGFKLQGDDCIANSRDDYFPGPSECRNSLFFGQDFGRAGSPSFGPYSNPTTTSNQPTIDWNVPLTTPSASSSTSSSDSFGFSPQTGSSSLASSWSEDNSLQTIKRPIKPMAAGEDPALAAARRALWADVPEEPLATLNLPVDPVTTPPDSPIPSDDEEEVSDETVVLRNARLFDLPPAPHAPSHASRPPLPSCLKSSSSFSSSVSSCTTSTRPLSPSSSLSSFSVQFCEAPPAAFVTYAKCDYERRGDAAVEKLSVRDWLELHDCKSVAQFSGKIPKWDAAEVAGQQDSATTPPCADSAPDVPTPTKLTLGEKRGASNLVLDAVRAMDNNLSSLDLRIQPHYSPCVPSSQLD